MDSPVRVIGRYALYGPIAAGGMATVHFGRLLGPVGFLRTVAIKRLHPQFAQDPEFVSMFLDEARLAARIRHPNVVSTIDVVATQGEVFLVMDYVQGESVARLVRTLRTGGRSFPTRIVSGVMCGALHGLHAAHEAKNERGEPLNIVHRDVSPQNILVGVDGVARVLDFGVAKAVGRIQTTRDGQLKGKLAYMAPEHISGAVSRRTDVYAAGIVLWEMLTQRRLFSGDNEAQVLAMILDGKVDPPSRHEAGISPEFDAIVLRALQRDPAMRFATAREFAVALERCVGIASPTEMGEWVEACAHPSLTERASRIAEIESSSTSLQGADDFPTTVDVGRTSIPEPQASQVSSISVSRASEMQPQGSRMWLSAVGALALVACVLTVVFFVRTSKPDAIGRAVSMTPTAPPTASSVSSVSASPEAPPSTSAPATLAGVVHPAKPVKPPPTGTTRGPASHPPRPSATAQPTSVPVTKPPGCEPPYTLDAAGHKKWRPECL